MRSTGRAWGRSSSRRRGIRRVPEGTKMVQRLLDLPMPMVGAANGRPQSPRNVCCWPASTSHPSARPTATSRISRSASPLATACTWSGRRSLERHGQLAALDGQRIDPQTTLQWGVVSEVVARDRAVDRGIEIARGLAAKPALYRTLQKQTLNVNLRRRIVQDAPFAIALEGLTAADL